MILPKEQMMSTKTIVPTWDEIEKRTDTDAKIIRVCISDLAYCLEDVELDTYNKVVAHISTKG